MPTTQVPSHNPSRDRYWLLVFEYALYVGDGYCRQLGINEWAQQHYISPSLRHSGQVSLAITNYSKNAGDEHKSSKYTLKCSSHRVGSETRPSNCKEPVTLVGYFPGNHYPSLLFCCNVHSLTRGTAACEKSCCTPIAAFPQGKTPSPIQDYKRHFCNKTSHIPSKGLQQHCDKT